MEHFTDAQHEALVEIRLTADRLSEAEAAQRHELACANAVGLASFPLAGGSFPVRVRRRFTAQQLEALRTVERATDALRVARNQQSEGLRRARALSIPVEVAAAEARVALNEVRRVTERVPVN